MGRKSSSLQHQSARPEVGVYDCEIHLKFRLVEDEALLGDREQLLERLLEAFSCGPDEYLEPILAEAHAEAVAETDASAQMRRQVIRLRNAKGVQ
ncbi:MAG: Npun_R1517 family heterocyst differentiation transcriptional regulator [Cyanobacteria bacterium P01_A01_bin.135]